MSVLWHGISIGNYGWYNNCECYCCCCLMIFMCAWQRNTMQTKDSGHERTAAQKKNYEACAWRDRLRCAVASSLYEPLSRETKTQLRSPALIKNSILSFCCSCRNLGAYLVSPQYHPVHTLPSQSHSDAAGCSSVFVSVLLDDKIIDGNANANYTILIIVFS